MFVINKITSDSVIDYAAEELKKYLRMMMPEGGDVKINAVNFFQTENGVRKTVFVVVELYKFSDCS